MVPVLSPIMTWLLAPHNTVFAAAFVLLVCLALLEGISLLLGLGLSDYLSDLLNLPDGDAAAGPSVDSSATVSTNTAASAAADADVQADADSTSSSASPLLSWLEIGKVPVLVSLCAFLAGFSISGMLLQQILVLTGPGPLVKWAAAAIAFVVALPVLKFSNRLLGRILPHDETSSFSAELLVGRVGIVTIGTASPDRAAEVKVTGPDGRSHYVMTFVRDASVPQGGEVLLERRDDHTGHYHGSRNTNPDLSPGLYL